MSKVFVDNCRDCMLPFQSVGDKNHKQLCDSCYQKHAKDFGRIRSLLEERPHADEKEIIYLLAVDPKVIRLYNRNLIKSVTPAEIGTVKPSIKQTKLSSTFQDKQNLIATDETADDIVAAGDSVRYFVLVENEAGIPERTPIHITNPRKGHRTRVLNVDADPVAQTSESVKALLEHGAQFAVYIEKDDHIIPAELHYWTDRPIQIEMKSNMVHETTARAKRVKVDKTLNLINALGVTAKGNINDISATGLSFVCAERIADVGETLHSGNKTIVIVNRQKLDGKYLYRGYFS